MGTNQQVYCAVSGDFSGGPNAHDRGDTSGVTRGAIDAFFASAAGGQKLALIGLGDLTGADTNSASYWRMKDIWGAESESVTCPGQVPAVTVRGAAGRCYDHTGTGPHTGYMSAAIRNVTLPIPGNHDRDSPDNPGPYDGYWEFWREKNGELSNQLRPNNLGFGGDTSGTAFRSGPFYYTADLPAVDGNSYWRVGLIDVAPFLTNNASQKTEILNWIDTELAAAAAATPARHMIWGWHEPMWQIGGSGYGTEPVRTIVDKLQDYTAGFMIIMAGHIHCWARWDPMLWNGASNFDTDATHGQTPVTIANYQAGAGGFVHIESGLGGQNPGHVPAQSTFATYWTNVANSTSGNCRPTATTAEGKNKAAVDFPSGSAAGTQPNTSTDPDTGQPGHPYGVTGLILDQFSFQVKFYGNRATYPNTPNVLVYDTSPTFTWAASGGGGGGGGGGGNPPPLPTGPAWRSAELYGGGGTQSLSFSPLGSAVIVGGDNNGPKVSEDSGVNWTPALGNDPDTSSFWQTVAVLWSRDLATPDRCWRACKGGFLVSNNRGLNWTTIPTWQGNFDHGDPDNDRPRVDGHCLDDDAVGHIFMVDNPGKVYRYTISGTNGAGGAQPVQIADLAGIGTSLYLDPIDKTILYVTIRNAAGNAMYQLHNIVTAGTNGATVRPFTGTGNPANCEEVVPVNEGGTTVLYVASANSVKKVNRGTGSSGNVTNTWTDISPGSVSGTPIWAGIDAIRVGGSTLVALGNANPTNQTGTNGQNQIYYSTNGGSSWTNLAGDDTNSDFVNAMGGAGGKPWWGHGLRAGAAAREKAGNEWITPGGNGGVESVAFDPAHTNLIIGAGQQGCYLFDTSAKKAYPAMIGIHSGVECSITIDQNDDDHIMVNNSDHVMHLTKTGGYGGDWRKNENNTAGGTTSSFQSAFDDNGGQWMTFGERFSNTMGDVIWNWDATLGTNWTLGLGPSGLSGAKPTGIAVRRIGGNDVVLIGVLRKSLTGGGTVGGIYKRTFSNPGTISSPPSGGTWARVESAFAANPLTSTQRAYQMFWASDTLAFAFDPEGGLWRSTNAGTDWTKIWTFSVGADERSGFMQLDPDNPGDLYISLGTSAGGAVKGVWHLIDANTGTVTAVPNTTPGTGEIEVRAINKTTGTKFVDPGVIAMTTNGRLGVMEWGTGNNNPAAYLSSDYGATFTDITDDYFRRGARKVFASAMTTTGRWFITMSGLGILVYDDSTSFGGDNTTPGGGGTGGNITRSVVMANGGWAVTDPPGTSFLTDTVTPVATVPGLLVVDIVNSETTTATAPTSVAGLGLTWTKREDEVITATDLSQRRITTWTAVCQGTETPGGLTVTFAGSQNGIAVEATEYVGVDLGAQGGGGTPETVTAQSPSGTVVNNDTTGASGGTVFTVGPFTPTAGAVIGLFLGAVAAGATVPAISTISDGSRTYTLREAGTLVNTDTYKGFVYTANAGGSPGSTTITVTFSTGLTGCNLQVVEFIDANTTTPTGLVANNAPGSGQPSISFASAPAATSLSVYFSFMRRNPPNWTPEAGWTQIGTAGGSGHSSPANGIQIAVKNGDQQFTATGTGGAHGSVLVEVVGAPSGVGDPVLQSNSDQWDGVTATRPDITLASPLTDPGVNALHAAITTPRNPAGWGNETGWTQLWDSGYNSPVTGIQVESILNSMDNGFQGPTGTVGRWAATILEIAATAGGGQVNIELSHDADFIAGTFKETSHDADFLATAIGLRELTSGSSDADGTVYTTASISPTSGRVVYLGIENARSDSVAAATPSSVTGAGLTWSLVDTLAYSENPTTTQRRRISVFKGSGTPSAGAVTMTFPGGSSLNGTYEAAVTLADRQIVGNSPRFIQSLTSGVSVTGDTAFAQTGGGFTLTMWVSQLTNAGNQRLIEQASANRVRMYMGAGTLHYGINQGGFQEGTWDDTELVINDGLNHHLAMRWDGDTTKIALFVDGIKVSETGVLGGTLSLLGNDNIRIGNKPTSGATSDGWDGWIDEVAWFKHALTDIEISDLVASFDTDYSAEVIALDPIAYWRFEETSGTVAANSVAPGTQTHAAWIAVESNGNTVLQTVTGTALDSRIAADVQPQGIGTALVFTGKRGIQLLNPGSGGIEINEVGNVTPNGRFSAGVYALPSTPTNIATITGETTDMGIVILELSALQSSTQLSHDADYIAFGTLAPAIGKKLGRKARLSRVFLTLGGNEVPMQDDWEFSETALGGYDKASFSVPLRYLRATPLGLHQDAKASFWNENGDELWAGTIDRPPEEREGVAHCEASGYQYLARQSSDRLFYQAIGTRDWATLDADPYNYASSERYDSDVIDGRMMITLGKDSTFDNGNQAGFVFWVPGENLRRIQFTVRHTSGGSLDNFAVKVGQQMGPSTPGLIEVASYQANAGDGTQHTKDLTGSYDLVAVFVQCTANNTNFANNQKLWISNISVNGIAQSFDFMSTSAVAKDIGRRLGYSVDDFVLASEINALPFDVNDQDWGDAMDYLSLLDGMPWQVYGDIGDGPVLHKAKWSDTNYPVRYEEGASFDLTPEPIYEQVRVVYRTPAGKIADVKRQIGNGRELPAYVMQDPQRDDDTAKALADRLLDEMSTERYSGTITLNYGNRVIRAGRHVSIRDWAPDNALGHQVADVSQNAETVSLGIRWPQIVSRFLARMERERQTRGSSGRAAR